FNRGVVNKLTKRSLYRVKLAVNLLHVALIACFALFLADNAMATLSRRGRFFTFLLFSTAALNTNGFFQGFVPSFVFGFFAVFNTTLFNRSFNSCLGFEVALELLWA